MTTSRETQDLISKGNSAIEFPERLIFVMSLDFHTSDGIISKPSSVKEISWQLKKLKKLKIVRACMYATY